MTSLISRFRWPMRGFMAMTLALVFALSFTISAFASVTLLRLSTDTFTNPDSQHATEVEPDTFAFGNTIVSAFQVGRFFNGGASDIGFATSSNGGKSFKDGFLPGTTVNSSPPGPYLRASDASVAFDAKHNVWIISYLGIKSPSGPIDVDVSRSTDGGFTWSPPVVVNASGHFNDKNWTVCDDTASSPFYGNCYTEFDNNSHLDTIQMSTSTDGGATWGAAQTTQNQTHGIGGQPLVQPNGTVIVPIVGFAGNKFLILAFVATDGGGSWGKTNRVRQVAVRAPAGGSRAGVPLPSGEMNASGKVYVVWSDCRFESGCTASDLVFSTSTDGLDWSPITRIPLDPIGSGVDHFIPGLAVDNSTSDGSAHLVVTFYFYPSANCTAATCQLETGVSTSADGGATWSSNTQVAGPMSLNWLPNTTQGRMVADYISTSFVGGPAFPAFAVATAPTGSVFNEAIFTVKGGLRVGGPSNSASDHSNAGGNDTQTGSSITDQ